MDEKSVDNGVLLRFYKRDENRQEVPLAVLGRVAEAMQQAVYLLAHQQEGIILERYGRISRDIEQQYTLLCEAIQPGSVVVPAYFQMAGRQYPQYQEVLDLLSSVGSAVVDNDAQRLAKKVPDPYLRRRLMEEMQAMVPSASSNVYVSVSGPRNLQFTLNETIRRNAVILYRAALAHPVEVNQRIITGRLTRINFVERKLTLQYPVTGREFDCVYSDDVELDLIGQRRDWIQVTGNVVLDAADNPIQVTDVQDILTLDLSPIELKAVDDEENKVALRFREPLLLTPQQDETKQILLLRHEPLGIEVFGYTRLEVESALHGFVWVLWDNVAQVPDEQLTTGAREVKARLLSMVEEVALAAG